MHILWTIQIDLTDKMWKRGPQKQFQYEVSAFS